MPISIKAYRTHARLVIATAKGHRRYTAETFREATELACTGKDLVVLSHEPSFSPPWRPLARFIAGKQVPLAELAKPLPSQTESLVA